VSWICIDNPLSGQVARSAKSVAVRFPLVLHGTDSVDQEVTERNHLLQEGPTLRGRVLQDLEALSGERAQLFREMDMPLEQIQAVLSATGPDERDGVIVDHLRHMERQLEQTQTGVASLRALLEGAPPPAVEMRAVVEAQALAVGAEVGWDDTETWLHDALRGLRRQLGEPGMTRAGPDGALYSAEYFETHLGRVTAFIPVTPTRDSGLLELPSGTAAVTVHRGPFADLDRARCDRSRASHRRGRADPRELPDRCPRRRR